MILKGFLLVTSFVMMSYSKGDHLKQSYFITRGREADVGQFPYQVFLESQMDKTTFYHCGGTLIDNAHVLTAAHCIAFKPEVGGTNFHTAKNITVLLGSIKIGTEPINRKGKLRNVEKIYVYPQWDGRFDDIAILRLDKQIESTKFVYPAKLNQNMYETGTVGDISGWGSRYTELKHYREAKNTNNTMRMNEAISNGLLSRKLMYVEAETISNKRCQKLLDKYMKKFKQPRFIMTKRRICTVSVGRGGGPCGGDSGGPVSINSDEIFAVTSLILGKGNTCPSGYPTIHSRVAFYRSWIKKVLKHSWSKIDKSHENEDENSSQ